jgi:hypothetical protein
VAFYGTQRFIIVVTRARHLSIAGWIQAVPFRPSFLTIVLILSSHPCLDFISDVFPSEYNFVCNSRVLHACYSPVHLTLRDLVVLMAFRSEYALWNCSFCSILQFRIWPSLTPHIFLSILISNNRNPFVYVIFTLLGRQQILNWMVASIRPV